MRLSCIGPLASYIPLLLRSAMRPCSVVKSIGTHQRFLRVDEGAGSMVCIMELFFTVLYYGIPCNLGCWGTWEDNLLLFINT